MLFVFSILLGCSISANTKYAEKSYCPQNYDCTWNHSYHVTQIYKCTGNNQCPNGFLCCPDCHYQHYICKIALRLPKKEKFKLQCLRSTTFCKQKFPYLGTHSYKCTIDGECEQEFLCCHDDCYAHKICKRAVKIEVNDVCPKDIKTCPYTLSYEKTKNYKCTFHSQCEQTHACCFDSCYTHKICKPKQEDQNLNRNCPISIRKQSCPNTNRTLSKYTCKSQDDCIFGYICCEDNCYDHKVCKLPNGAFSYRKVYNQKSFTTPSLDEQFKCPKVEEKCTKPYSLRLAKKFICFKNEDCKIGQLCCKDSCVKDFRICKNLFTLKPEHQIIVGKTLVTEAVASSSQEKPITSSTIVTDLTLQTFSNSSKALTLAQLALDNLITAPSFENSTLEMLTSSNVVPTASGINTLLENNVTVVPDNFQISEDEMATKTDTTLDTTEREEFSLKQFVSSGSVDLPLENCSINLSTTADVMKMTIANSIFDDKRNKLTVNYPNRTKNIGNKISTIRHSKKKITSTEFYYIEPTHQAKNEIEEGSGPNYEFQDDED